MITAGVIGATGYTGVELLRLLSGHPNVEIRIASSRSEQGRDVCELFPSLRGAIDLVFSEPDNPQLHECDVVFFATPNAVAMHYAEVLLDTPQNCYTEDEIRVISRFAEEIGLEWGGVDVLRDNASGKIYIVDANKTDMGPPVALKLGDKLKSTRRMAKAFVSAFAPKRR